MRLRTTLRCLGCGAQYAPDTLMNLCPVDHRPVQVVVDIEGLKHAYPDLSWYRPERKSLWRFGPLLGFDPEDAQDAKSIVNLGEGYTPHLNLSNDPLAKALDVKLFIKDEGMAHPGYGANPTGSFKDRGMVMVATMARELGLSKLAVPTQGNAGDSLTRYALAAGMDIAVVMPNDTPMPIMGQVAAESVRTQSVKLELVEGTIREAGARIKSHWMPQDYFSCATFQEPGWRIEGKKTLGLEIAEPRPESPGWSLPDVIVYPTGGGTGVLGMWKAFDELEALGLIGSQRPRMVCVQSEATPPLMQAWEQGDEDTTAAEAGHTLAVGLNVPGGVGHFKVLEIMRKSQGRALVVDEQTMAAACQHLWREHRIWICPEGAACYAAIQQLHDLGELSSGETLMLVNTGSAEKYLDIMRHLLA